VRERRHLRSQGAEERDVFGRVRQVVVAAKDMSDPHVRIVNADREVIERVAVGADEDEVVEGLGGELDAAADEIVDDDGLGRHLQAHHELLAGMRAAVALVGRDRATGAGVTVRAPLRLRLLAVEVELLGSLEGAVRFPLGNQPVGGGPVEVVALRLMVRALVVLEPEPLESREDLPGELLARPFDVGVFDPEDVGALLPAREEEVVQRRARASDVQKARGGGRETDARAGAVRQGAAC